MVYGVELIVICSIPSLFYPSTLSKPTKHSYFTVFVKIFITSRTVQSTTVQTNWYTYNQWTKWSLFPDNSYACLLVVSDTESQKKIAVWETFLYSFHIPNKLLIGGRYFSIVCASLLTPWWLMLLLNTETWRTLPAFLRHVFQTWVRLWEDWSRNL